MLELRDLIPQAMNGAGAVGQCPRQGNGVAGTTGRRAACHRLFARHRQDRRTCGDLEQAGQLTAIEIALVRTHAKTGYDILKNWNFPGRWRGGVAAP